MAREQFLRQRKSPISFQIEPGCLYFFDSNGLEVPAASMHFPPPDNAAIFNADGSLRFQLKNPWGKEGIFRAWGALLSADAIVIKSSGDRTDLNNIGGTNLASEAGANAAANNWLAAQQRTRMAKESSAAKTPLEQLKVMGRWTLVSAKQDALTASGVGKGLVDSGISDIQGLADFLSNPVEGLNGLKQIITSPEARQQLGASVFVELDAKIDRMKTALELGGDQNAEQLGKDLGGLIWQVGTVVTGAGAAAKGGVALTNAAVSLGTRTLESAALQFMKLDAGVIRGFKSADEINAMMKAADGWSPAWKSGTTVAETTMKPGTTVRMVVSERAWNDIKDGNFERAFGGWATFDDVPNSAYARDKLAITADLTAKSGPLYVIDVQVGRPVNAQVGAVGAQGSAAGGGNQLHFFLPPADRSSVFKVVGGRAL